jgi:hypothetical protein
VVLVLLVAMAGSVQLRHTPSSMGRVLLIDVVDYLVHEGVDHWVAPSSDGVRRGAEADERKQVDDCPPRRCRSCSSHSTVYWQKLHTTANTSMLRGPITVCKRLNECGDQMAAENSKS